MRCLPWIALGLVVFAAYGVGVMSRRPAAAKDEPPPSRPTKYAGAAK